MSFVRRGKSILGREEKDENEDPRRHIAAGGGMSEQGGAVNMEYQESFWKTLPNPWLFYCRLLTCCIPGSLLSAVGIPAGPAHMAWREKMGLISFIALVMGFVGFLTFGFTQAICPTPAESVQGGQVNTGYVIIQGWAYLLSEWEGHPPISGQTSDNTNIMYSPVNAGGMDASLLFQDTTQTACTNIFGNAGTVYFPCQLFNPNTTDVPDPSTFSNQTQCHLTPTARNMYTSFREQGVPKSQGGFDKSLRVYYDWDLIDQTTHLMVYNGDVLNLRLLKSLPSSTTYPSGGLIEAILTNETSFGGQDITRALTSRRNTNIDWEIEAECLASIIKVGSVDTISIGCMASQIVLYLSLAVILGVILTKFFLAVSFGWFFSWRLGNFKEGQSYAERMKRQAEIEDWSRNITSTGPIPIKPYMNSQINLQNKKKSILPQTSRFTQPQNVMRFDAERGPSPYWKNNSTTGLGRQSMYMSPSPSSRLFSSTPGDMTPRRSSISSSDMSSSAATTFSCPFPLSPHVVPQPSADYMPFKYPLAHTVCLVTCYSEGEEGIRTTLDSIATSDYPNSHKLILVICDGIITGSGNNQSTPEACLSMMRDFIVPPHQVQPAHYIAIADGSKQNNMAKVYAGYYKYKDETVDPAHQQRVPMVTIVKCGTPEETSEPKPGNRGKRDSQIILMQFMQKVIFDERLTQMEYEFFNHVWRVTGVPADSYEICLMVDADTKLYPDALSRMVSCCVKDPEISGLCGETKIANKTDSWVSMIQVFEYYISHHMNKAFEAIFGGVTCLPGCFCMYRIKAPKGPTGYWVPVLANPDVVQHYSENVVDTLHKKNLLLLGEDRYLSTLMLKIFPNRKMMFVPQAVCKTVVPDSFKVLLSQRRRWINSTIHNLMELLFVHDLCGTFCFSMQFVVFMELVGTLALPAAIAFTLYLIILAIIGQPAIIPLVLLALILGLPAVLIVMTSRKVVYVGWMLIYLISLPIWNFVLPMYAYWHFDDFSWGDTRKVEGSEKDRGHGVDPTGQFDSSRIVMKKWSEYEKERRIHLALEHNLPVPKFLEPPKSVDIFRESLFQQSHTSKKNGSTGSSDSEAPLAEMDFQAIRHPPVQLSDPPMQMTSLNTPPRGNDRYTNYHNNIPVVSTPSSSSSASTPTHVIPSTSIDPISFKIQNTSSSDWANPAPHHKPNTTRSKIPPSTPTPERTRGISPPTQPSVAPVQQQQQQQQQPQYYTPMLRAKGNAGTSSNSATDRTLPQHSSPLSQSTTPSSEEQQTNVLLSPQQQQLSVSENTITENNTNSSSSNTMTSPLPTSTTGTSSNRSPPTTGIASNKSPSTSSPLATVPPTTMSSTNNNNNDNKKDKELPSPPPKTMDTTDKDNKPLPDQKLPPIPPPHEED
ncbi:chitin synthase-domain-containing protein [Circinella umbellata]|nr:chitin synthase-domain-containing protein [Circinella umbellata]